MNYNTPNRDMLYTLPLATDMLSDHSIILDVKNCSRTISSVL